MKGQTVLITGATSGIGKETARGIARAGAKLVIAGRDPVKAEAVCEEIISDTGNEDLEIMELDLASLRSIRAFARRFLERFEELHVLINNAGIFSLHREETVDGFEKTIGTNHLGPFLLTNLILPVVQATAPGARVVNVASAAHAQAKLDLDDLHMSRRYRGFPAYANSKLANILFTLELAERLRRSPKVTVNAVHPGHVATGIWPSTPWYMAAVTRAINLFALSPEQGAEAPLYVATSEECRATSGAYFNKRRLAAPVLPRDERALRARLWELSKELTGLESSAGLM